MSLQGLNIGQEIMKKIMIYKNYISIFIFFMMRKVNK